MMNAYFYIGLYLLCMDVGTASIMPQIAFKDIRSVCARVKHVKYLLHKLCEGAVASPGKQIIQVGLAYNSSLRLFTAHLNCASS